MSEVIQRTKADVQAIAAEMDLVCILPQADEIMLDWDDVEGSTCSRPIIQVLENNGVYLEEGPVTLSQNGNRHGYYSCNKPLTALERILIQACMGSDPVKEVLSLIRIMEGRDPMAAIAMFETPEEAKGVYEWRKKRKRL